MRYRSILPAYRQRTQRHHDNNHDETIWRRGELLAEMDKNKGAREQGVGRRGKNAVVSSNRVPKLSDLGVSQTQAGELLAEMKTRGERREHSQRSPRATSENLPPKLSDLGNSLRLKTGDRACSARQRPLYRLHASGIAAGSDDAEGGARLVQRLRIDVGLGGRLLEVAHLLGAMGERVAEKALCALAALRLCRLRFFM